MRRIMLAVMAAVLTLGACTSIDCPMNHQVYTAYGLYKSDGTIDTLNTDTLWVFTQRADRTDSMLVNALTGSSATYFNLPVSHMQPEDTFYVVLADTSGNYYYDMIYVKKDNYPHFESVDCQASYFHEIKSVRWDGDIIDSIVIKNPYSNYDTSKEHFHIYFNHNR